MAGHCLFPRQTWATGTVSTHEEKTMTICHPDRQNRHRSFYRNIIHPDRVCKAQRDRPSYTCNRWCVHGKKGLRL